MRTSILLSALAALSLFTSCDQKPQNGPPQVTMDKSEAKAAAKDIPYRAELEKGIAMQFNIISIPKGEVQIMSGLSSQMEQADYKNKRFPQDFLKFLEEWKKDGLVLLTETKQNELDLVGSMGTRKFKVVPTAAAIEVSDKQLPDNEWLCIPLGTCRIKTVVKDIEYRNVNLPQSDDFRLVVGTYERTYNDFAKKEGASDKPKTFKFRALVKVNPFNQTYTFQVADWGNLNEDDWKTTNIAH